MLPPERSGTSDPLRARARVCMRLYDSAGRAPAPMLREAEKALLLCRYRRAAAARAPFTTPSVFPYTQRHAVHDRDCA